MVVSFTSTLYQILSIAHDWWEASYFIALGRLNGEISGSKLYKQILKAFLSIIYIPAFKMIVAIDKPVRFINSWAF